MVQTVVAPPEDVVVAVEPDVVAGVLPGLLVDLELPHAASVMARASRAAATRGRVVVIVISSPNYVLAAWRDCFARWQAGPPAGRSST
jgi:hypothetical protein